MIRDHSGNGHSQWQIVLMFPIGCDHTKNYVWMNNSIFLRPGSNDRLPIYIWYLAFQWTFSHPAVFSLENVQSLNVYFLWIFLRHGIPLTRQQYVNNNVTDTPKVISLYNSK